MKELTEDDSVRAALRDVDPDSQSVTARASTFDRESFQGAFIPCFEHSRPSRTISRSDVREEFERDTRSGILLAFIWGFPNGGRGNAGKSLCQNLGHLTRAVEQARTCGCLPEVWESINQVRGLNFATTTKFLYFANAKAGFGPCLIFDARVRTFLLSYRPAEFKGTLDSLERIRFYGLPFGAYANYVAEMEAASEKLKCSSDALEFYMFREAPRYRKPRHQP